MICTPCFYLHFQASLRHPPPTVSFQRRGCDAVGQLKSKASTRISNQELREKSVHNPGKNAATNWLLFFITVSTPLFILLKVI